jgi:hypothetical protein
VNVRLNPEEVERLKIVSARLGLNGQQTFRLLLAQEANRLGQSAKTKAKPKAKR